MIARIRPRGFILEEHLVVIAIWVVDAAVPGRWLSL
jgi:hypothetical protein